MQNALIAVGMASILIYIQELLGTNYLIQFLKRNLVSLLIALLAINIASLGIILSKIREIMDHADNQVAFEKTRKEMVKSIWEQIILIFISLILFMALGSETISGINGLLGIIQVLIVACFTYAITILYDTAKSVFIVLDIGKKKNNLTADANVTLF